MEEDLLLNEDISEIPEYSPKSEFSKGEIVKHAVISCREHRAQEMIPGYYNTTLTKTGQPIKTWVPDAREKYFGSVIALRCLLSPEINRDNKTKTVLDNFYKTCKELKDKYSYEEFIFVFNKGEIKYIKSGRKYMPRIDQKIVIEVFDKRIKRYVGEEVVGGWNEQINNYKNELIELYDILFAELNDLIDRLNYFKSGVSF